MMASKENYYHRPNNSNRDADLHQCRKEDLKEMCREQGLKISGNKDELVARLENPTKAVSKPSSRRLTCEQVHQMLKEAGYDDPESASNCTKRAIQRGYISLDGDLDKIIFKGGKCFQCSHKGLSCTLRELLDQPDWAGYGGFSDGGQDGAVQCENCMENGEPYGMFLTLMCEGAMCLDSGRNLNHCTECPGKFFLSSLQRPIALVLIFFISDPFLTI
jgi:hypothetical protein